MPGPGVAGQEGGSGYRGPGGSAPPVEVPEMPTGISKKGGPPKDKFFVRVRLVYDDGKPAEGFKVNARFASALYGVNGSTDAQGEASLTGFFNAAEGTGCTATVTNGFYSNTAEPIYVGQVSGFYTYEVFWTVSRLRNAKSTETTGGGGGFGSGVGSKTGVP